MYCPNCDSEVESTVRVISETYPVKGEDITIDAHVRVCNCCGTDLWDENLDEQNLLDAFAEYRKRHHLMQPADIRATREKYGLSQTAFAPILGFGDKTITRYENGSIADAAQNNLIYLVQQPSDFANLLEKNKDKISIADYHTARTSLDALRCKIVYPESKKAYTYSTNEGIKYSMKPEYWGDQNYA